MLGCVKLTVIHVTLFTTECNSSRLSFSVLKYSKSVISKLFKFEYLERNNGIIKGSLIIFSIQYSASIDALNRDIADSNVKLPVLQRALYSYTHFFLLVSI